MLKHAVFSTSLKPRTSDASVSFCSIGQVVLIIRWAKEPVN